MERVPGLRHHTYFYSRQALRARFRRFSPHSVFELRFFEEGQTVPHDADVLKLLLDTTRQSNAELAAAQQEYSARHAHSTNQLPSLQNAMDRGWFRAISGELVPAGTLRDFLRYSTPSPAYAQELRDFLTWLHGQHFVVAGQGSHGSASELEAWLLRYPRSSGERPTALSGPWIAARVWDAAQQKDLRAWISRWELLSCPRIIPSKVWTPQEASVFREALLEQVRNANLPGWEIHEAADAILRKGDIHLAATTEIRPSHLLGLYLESGRGLDGREVYENGSLMTALGQLVLELPYIHPAPVPSLTVEALLNLALAHPDVLTTLVHYVRQEPEALADLVLCPAGCALTTYLVATWTGERDDLDTVAEEVRISLLRDCLSVLTHFLGCQSVTAGEYACLLVALQDLDANAPSGVQRFQAALDILAAASANLRAEIVGALVGQLDQERRSTLPTLLKVVSATDFELSAAQGGQIAQHYQRWAAPTTPDPNAALIDTSAAGALLKATVRLAGDAGGKILRPIDVRAVIEAGGSDATFKLSLALKEHIRVLCRGIAGYPETVPDSIVAALADAIRSGACDRPNRYQVDAFSFDFGYTIRKPPRLLELDVLAAVNRLESAAQRAQVVDALLLVEEPLVLAPLARRGPRDQQERIRNHLMQFSPDKASLASFVPQLQRRVDAFLELGMTDLASSYLQVQQERLQGRPNGAEAQLLQLRTELQLSYLKGDDQSIHQAVVPAGLAREYELEANRTVRFYRGLVLLRQKPPDGNGATAIFYQLYREQPESSYAINLLAARVIKLLGDQLYRLLTGAELTMGKLALAEADAALPKLGSLSASAQVPHAYNMTALLLATGKTQEAYSRLQLLDPAVRNSEAVAFEAVALARLGEEERALALIRTARARYADAEAVIAAEQHILHSTSSPALAHALQHEDADTRIREAMALFRTMSPERQAAALVSGTNPLEQVFTNLFRDALASFERLLPSLKLHQITYAEDDFNGLLAELVEARMDTAFGWQAHEQSPGGFTESGNPRRRDMVVRVRGADVAAFEALIAQSPSSPKIVEHLHKLFSYTTARILVHVTYSFRTNASEMVAGVKRAALNSPNGSEYLNQLEIPAEGSRPGGIRAAYRRGGVDIAVLFFVVDMAQVALRLASTAPPALVPSGMATPADPPLPSPIVRHAP